MNVDSTLTANHDPETADANDTFSLNNGVLSVTTNRTTAGYYLENGSLKIVVTDGATISAEATFSERSIDKTITFSYNHNGLRTQKKVIEHGITTIYDYTLHGKLITHLTKRVVNEEGVETGSDELHFFYDDQFKPVFVEFEGVKYRYLYNLQGDVVAIVDSAGNTVVEYKYDGWGNPDNTAAETGIGAISPFRYRGYVWDREMDLFYLRSRYYCPKWTRFLNKDILLGPSEEVLSINQYAYCKNSPVIHSDPSGHLLNFVVGLMDALGKMIYGWWLYGGGKKLTINMDESLVAGSKDYFMKNEHLKAK